MDFTKLTKEARERQKPPTGYQLAKALGVTPGAVYRWEEGGRKPTGDNLLKLLRLAGKLAITAIGFFVAIGVAPVEKVYAESNSQLRNELTKNTDYAHIRSAQRATSNAA